jgi:hypothetical protein
MWQKVLLRAGWVIKNAEPADSEAKIKIGELENRIIDFEAELTELHYDMVLSENDELRSTK